MGVATDGSKVVVADTYNDRLLIWTTFPSFNGQSADLSIELSNPTDPRARIEWPWDVWTDGTILIATATPLSSVLIWYTFPTFNDQTADLSLQGKSPVDGVNKFGTPRTIGTDGLYYLVIGDHNPQGQSAPTGNFFWNTLPTLENQEYYFFMANSQDENQLMWGGTKTQAGKFAGLTPPGLSIWDSVPTAVTAPDLFVDRSEGEGYSCTSGDGSDLVETGSGKLICSLYNKNMMVGFDAVPAFQTDVPDFAIGSPDINTNTLDTYYIITNAVPATDGSHLFVSSDFDDRLYVWNTIPTSASTTQSIAGGTSGTWMARRCTSRSGVFRALSRWWVTSTGTGAPT